MNPNFLNQEVIARLALPQHLLNGLAGPHSYEDKCVTLDELKSFVKKRRRRLAKIFHPDVKETGDAEMVQKINDICEQIIGSRIQRPPTQRVNLNMSNYRGVF